jgi:LysM domain-containing protein
MMLPLLVTLGLGYGAYRLFKKGKREPLYTFAKGDQASAVAARFGVTVGDIQKANGTTTLRMVAPDGSPTSIYLPMGVSDKGASMGAMGKVVL